MLQNFQFRFFLVYAVLFFITACSSSPPAPVIDRLPQQKSGEKSSSATQKKSPDVALKSGDWRPEIYTVKKGDTLYGIGLEFGYSYKEIAEFNEIAPPYPIKIGQILKLKPKTVATNAATSTGEYATNSDEVTTIPFGQDDAPITPKSTENTTTSMTTPTLVGPKATREPFSEEALNKASPILPPTNPTPPTAATEPPKVEPAKTEIAKSTQEIKAPPKPATEPKNDAKSEILAKYDQSESVEWAWPHQGKIINGFNEATNKGIDIGGQIGQSVNAAASGKVIYSGADLRGYGKLVIIKHNALYLSVYAHNSVIHVKEGQVVTRGQKIAEMGNSESPNVKLHFEIRRQGRSVDPKLYLPPQS
jgi:lipoprotein NlpD